LYASFLNKGMAAFMRRTGSPKGSPHFPSAGKFIMRHAVPHDWETRLNALHLWAGGRSVNNVFEKPACPNGRAVSAG